MAVRKPQSKSKPPSDPLEGFLPKGDPTRPYVRRRPNADRPDSATPPGSISPASRQTNNLPTAEAVLVAEPDLVTEPSLVPEPNLVVESGIPAEPNFLPEPIASNGPAIADAPNESSAIPLHSDRPVASSPDTIQIAPEPLTEPTKVTHPSVPRKTKRGRKKKTPVVLYLASTGMAIIVGVLAYFVLSGDQRLQLAKDGSGITIAEKAERSQVDRRQTDEGEITIEVPADDPALQRQRADQTTNADGNRNRNSLGASLPSDLNNDLDDSAGLDRTGSMKDSPAESMPPTVADNPNDASQETDTPETSPAMDPPSVDDSMMTKGREALEAAFAAIDSGDLKTMGRAIDRAVAAAADSDQQEIAGQYEQLVDLATFYDGAVDRTIDQLQAAQVLNITPSLIASVVEASSDRLVLKINGTNKRFARDSLPMVLIDHLAADSLEAGDETALAAKSAYHAVAKAAGTTRHRRQAIGWLQTLDQSKTEVDVEGITLAIRDLLRGYLSGGGEQ